MTDINAVISRLEQAESVSYFFHPGTDQDGPDLHKDQYPHAPSPCEQSIWFKVYE